MNRFRRTSLLLAAAALFSGYAWAQTPDEPLGELLEVIPLPEDRPTPALSPESPAKPEPAPMPAPTPPVRPGSVVPVDLPPSSIPEEALPAPAEAEAVPVEVAAPPATDMADQGAAKTDADAAAEADARWTEMQEQRRRDINAVESPIIDRLNAEVAARAAAETRRIEEERAAYERSLIEAEEEARRVEAEHRAVMEEHARRVAREQAEYRARVEACLNGDRQACRTPDEKR
ncbi:hypothetical protein [Sphingosinicella terrae]|uniref:hypothetical protein n=1 Tax=Sphingosinicella terrae TaxID=2172047 RepID=UPI000E0CDA2F|nr:hypothetical protein [Sphingosinicella terrae]